MANVLPHDLKRQNHKEYHIRFLIMIEVLVSVVFVFSTMLVIPSYIVSTLEEENKAEQMRSINEYNAKKVSDSREDILESTKASLDVLSESRERTKMTPIIDRLLSVMKTTGGIEFSGIRIESASENIQSTSVVFSGVASTRDKLLMFTNELNNTEGFKGAVLPVSNLKEYADLPFSVSFNVEI